MEKIPAVLFIKEHIIKIKFSFYPELIPPKFFPVGIHCYLFLMRHSRVCLPTYLLIYIKL